MEVAMPGFKYLVVGGGMTADAAIKGIREVDSSGTIGLIGAEPHPPYNRPPLTKGLWQGKPIETVWRKRPEEDAQLILGRSVRAVDPANRRVTDDQGATYSFQKALLATGGTPCRLSSAQGEDVIYYRTLDDYQKLREWTRERRHIGVIGGGFIGSELAASLNMNGLRVTMVIPEEGPGARIFPADLTEFVRRYYVEKGVEVLAGHHLRGVERKGSRPVLQLEGPDRLETNVEVEGVVAGFGIKPNTGLAAAAGIEVDDGIVVDDFLRAGHPDIYAAGDVASFYSVALRRRMRVEHEDNAVTMGRLAGQNMAGETHAYHHVPFFYSDLFDLGYEAVGDLDVRLPLVAEWAEPYRKGVVYYMRDSRVCGVLLWNVWGQMSVARALLAELGPFTPEDLRGRIPLG
jgi:3-phenylpropionate/trans-cinnamate dioxygenase ferredoxin reductase subunit